MATPQEMEAAMVRNLEEKTGKSLTEWLAIVVQSGLEKHGQILKLLKGEHGLTHGYANLVAHRARQAASPPTNSSGQSVSGDDNQLIDNQYSGPKAALRSIYEAVINEARAFGGDVEIAPKKAYVSLRRKKQFALVQPSTRTRVDVGINLKGTEPTPRLEASGGASTPWSATGSGLATRPTSTAS